MRTLIFVLAATILTSNVFSAEPDEKLHKQCLYPTVMILSKEGSSGTGTIIRSEKISEKEYYNVALSCSHILSKDPNIEYRVYRGEYKNWSNLDKIVFYPAVVCGFNSDMDLSVFCFISSTEMPVAELGMDVKTFIGTDIIKIGCGGEEYFRLDYGKITSLNKKLSNSGEAANRGLTRTSVYTLPGDSGGPVFQEYKLIGIVHSIRTMDSPITHEAMLLEHISYFIPIVNFVEWNEASSHLYDFVFDKTKSLPKIEHAQLKLLQYEIIQ